MPGLVARLTSKKFLFAASSAIGVVAVGGAVAVSVLLELGLQAREINVMANNRIVRVIK